MRLRLNKRFMFLFYTIGVLCSILIPIIPKILLLGVLIFMTSAYVSSTKKKDVVVGSMFTACLLGLLCTPPIININNSPTFMSFLVVVSIGIISVKLAFRGLNKLYNSLEEKEVVVL